MAFLKSFPRLHALTSRNKQTEQHKHTNHNETKPSPNPDLSYDILPPLRPVILPHILPSHQETLSNKGWTTITPSATQHNQDPLFAASHTLLQASTAFFALPQTYKSTFLTQSGTEAGWFRVEGEKEYITLRTLSSIPPELRDAVVEYWKQAGNLLHEILGRVAESLGLEGERLMVFSEACREIGTGRTASMVRLFRYEGVDGGRERVVAEPHNDLGLLSLVIGDKPGLEVWDRNTKSFFPIEKSYQSPAATLLVGKQLERLTNKRYPAGGHLVRSYRGTASKEKNYRYSIVFVLRAHSPVLIDTDDLTSSITGDFEVPLKDITAGELYSRIQKAHFNINTTRDEREEQRLEVRGNLR